MPPHRRGGSPGRRHRAPVPADGSDRRLLRVAFREAGGLLVEDVHLDEGWLAGDRDATQEKRGRGTAIPEPKTQSRPADRDHTAHGGRRTRRPPPGYRTGCGYRSPLPRPGGGSVFNGDNWRKRVWRPAVEASVGEPCRFHHLRHSQASLAVGLAGVHPKLMSRRLGHASTRVTERYTHVDERAGRPGRRSQLDGSRLQTLTEQGRNKPVAAVARLSSPRKKGGRPGGLRVGAQGSNL